MAAMATTAKASLTSNRSTSPSAQPVRCIRRSTAPTGAVGNRFGASANDEWPRIAASGVKPRFSASDRRISTSAAAPSEIELALAAVTVPPSRKAGFRVGILSSFAFGGCSSLFTDGTRFLAGGHRDRDDLGLEAAFAHGLLRAGQRGDGEVILLLRG